MATEKTAEVIVGSMRGTHGGTSLVPHHRLTMIEGFRPMWIVRGMGGARQRQTVSRPDSPDNLLAHGLQAYLAHAHPEVVITHPSLAEQVRIDRRRGGLVTTVPSDGAARLVAKALPGDPVLVIVRFPRCGIEVAETDHLVDAGVRMVGFDCSPRRRLGRRGAPGGAA